MIEELTSRVQEELVPIISGNASVEEKLYQLIKVLLDEHPTNLFLMLNDMFQEMGPDYNRTLYQIFKTYINNIAAIFESEPETNCLQEGISVDDATRFILYNVSALLSIEKRTSEKQWMTMSKIHSIYATWRSEKSQIKIEALLKNRLLYFVKFTYRLINNY